MTSPAPNWVLGNHYDDGDLRRSPLRGHGGSVDVHDDHIDVEVDEFGSERGKPLGSALSESVLHGEIPAFHVAEFAEPSQEGFGEALGCEVGWNAADRDARRVEEDADPSDFHLRLCRGGAGRGEEPKSTGKERAPVHYGSVDSERLHQFQEIRSLNPQNLRGSGAVATRLAEGLQHQLAPAGVDAGPVREAGGGVRPRLGGHDSRRQIVHSDLPISFLDKKIKPIGACSRHSITSLFLPGHLIPATFFNDFSSLPATYFPEFFKFLLMVRLLHK